MNHGLGGKKDGASKTTSRRCGQVREFQQARHEWAGKVKGFRNHGMDGRKKRESTRNHTQCGQGKIKRFSKDAQYGRDVGRIASSPRVFEKIQSLTETQVANDLSRDNGFSSRDHVTVYRPQS